MKPQIFCRYICFNFTLCKGGCRVLDKMSSLTNIVFLSSAISATKFEPCYSISVYQVFSSFSTKIWYSSSTIRFSYLIDMWSRMYYYTLLTLCSYLLAIFSPLLSIITELYNSYLPEIWTCTVQYSRTTSHGNFNFFMSAL